MARSQGCQAISTARIQAVMGFIVAKADSPGSIAFATASMEGVARI